jgi:hypothetical protein
MTIFTSCDYNLVGSGNRYLVNLQNNLQKQTIISLTDSLHSKDVLKVADSLNMTNFVAMDPDKYKFYYLTNPEELYYVEFTVGVFLAGHYSFLNKKWTKEEKKGPKKFSLKERERINQRFKKDVLEVIVKEARSYGMADSLIFKHGDTLVK